MLRYLRLTTLCLTFLLSIITFPSFSFILKNGYGVLQLGGHFTHQGREQFSPMQGLIGDIYTVNKHQDSNVLVGLAYLVKGRDINNINLYYGLNAFYLGRTRVAGQVIQEQIFTNLSYNYHLTHYPLYVEAKAISSLSPNYSLTFDVGIGPNFVTANGFRERSLDGITNPDNPFSKHTNTTFSAMAGVGLVATSIFGKFPLECGYRFFYLGQGHFNRNTNQLLQRNFQTGQNYSNAVLCSLTV